VRDIVITQAITGMGGLGKTQLAVEFAYRYGQYFRGVHWLDLANPSQLEAEIARCGMEMSLANFPADQPSQVALTLNTWKADGPRLLVLDNFEAVEQAGDVLTRLRHSSLHLLVTSRRTDWTPASGLRPLPLELFTPKESVAFLTKALEKRKDMEADLNTLAERLGHLPLALELASRYLNGHPRLTITEYLTQLQKAFNHPSMRNWRKDHPAATQHDLDLGHTFALSWEAIKDETTQKIFLTAGYLAPNSPISLEIFEKALEITSETCDEALDTLYGLGLLRKSEDNLPTIHPLLAEYARGLAKENRKILENLAVVLGTLSKETIETGLPILFLPLKAHIPVVAMYTENAGLLWAALLWNQYGLYLKEMIADFVGARLAYENSLKLYEQELGANHEFVATLINNLGGINYSLGDLAGARKMFERAIKIAEAAFGSDHLDLAAKVNNLGLVMQASGDLAGARKMFERALVILEKMLPPGHQYIARTFNNLGLVMQASGDLAGARKMLERALKIDEAIFGSNHPDIARDINNLGSVIEASGDLAGARTMYERALEIFKTFLPPDHPNIKTVQGNLDSLEE